MMQCVEEGGWVGGLLALVDGGLRGEKWMEMIAGNISPDLSPTTSLPLID